ncbi:MAG: tetratricopeptide repeat protein [Acidimicrobiia bacterium]|nr:tetratricopeptide repeat protein [Acidimicrobiia bacterium]
MTCPSCGADAPPEARFCPTCGHALVTRPDERRVATLVFGDLVGFTALSESADPEQVKRLVDTCFEAMSGDVLAYGGRVDKIVGDEIVAIFGAPVAHEDDAERAVRCALQMQRTLASLSERLGADVEMRVGVNTGEVLVGALRGGGDFTAMGDVVNIASRLQSAATPGQVIVGPLTEAAARDAIRYEPLGPLQMKGRDEAVEAWVALETVAPPGGRRRRRARTPIVGRDAELTMLRGILDAAASRRRAHLVIITADAGVGKSRLVGEIIRSADGSSSARVLRGHCVPYGEDVWWPVAEIIRDVCAIDRGPDDTTETVRVAVNAALSEIFGADLDDDDLTRTSRGLLYLLGHGEDLHDLDPTRARDDAIRSVLRLLTAIARDQTLIVTLSDLHWADELVLTMVGRLVEGLRGLPFALFATTRPELLDRWRPEPGRHNLTLLNLDPLDADAVTALARELLGPDVEPDLVAVLYERSGGNPFFVEELAALLRETDLEQAVHTLDPGRLPATLRGLVAARLDALSAGERNALEDCAVVGSSGSIETVRALVDARGDAIDVDDALARLGARELIDRDRDNFVFASEVVRDVAYGTLAKAERARRHAVLGAWLAERPGAETSTGTVERAAHHYGIVAELLRELGSVSGVSDDFASRALPVLEAAARRATESEVWRNAARLYDQCLALTDDHTPDTDRWRLLLGRAHALAERRELAEARADLDEVFEDAPSGGRVHAMALTQLGEIHQMAGDYPGSFETMEEALAMWRALGDEHGLATALRTQGRTAMFHGNFVQAEADCTEALELYHNLRDRRGEAWALQNLATIAFFRGDAEVAEQRLSAAGEMFHDLNDWGGLNWSWAILAWTRFIQGRTAEAEQIATEQLPESEARGDAYVSGILEMLLGNLAMWEGRSAVAVERARRAVNRFRLLGDPWAIANSRGVELRARVALGEVDDALSQLDEEVGGDDHGMYPALRAQVLVQLGDPEALAASLHVTASVDSGMGFSREMRRTLGLALLQAGRIPEAVAALEAITGAEECGPADAAALGLAYAAARRPSDVEAIEAFASAGTYLDRLQRDLADAFALVQRGDPAAAAAFDAVLAEIDTTESRLDQAIVRLARAHAWRALGLDDAPAAEHEANARLASLGIEAPGWVTVFSAATGA